MSNLQLVSHHLCPYVQRAVIVLSEKNIPYDRTYIDLAKKPDWFQAVSPLGKVPILITGETSLFESQVIAEYLDEITPGSLHPANPLDRARHRAWIEFGSVMLNAIGGFYSAKDAAVFEEKRRAIRIMFTQIEQEIEGPFFDGDTFHMVDGVWGTIFRYFDVFDQFGGFGAMTNLDQVLAWRGALALRKTIINAVPEGYDARLMQFLKNRNSYLSTLMEITA
jgi:glutathione S-transferase